jgi:hypothetical protein
MPTVTLTVREYNELRLRTALAAAARNGNPGAVELASQARAFDAKFGRAHAALGVRSSGSCVMVHR